ncbi:MAG TPA: hypothetical protein VFW50_08540 [Streptosporangiaceae bacterium]|nr:hypothetical protein [Streptosporangiaceae bacterium]
MRRQFHRGQSTRHVPGAAANQAAQVNLVSGDATAHEDPVLSVDVDAVYALHAAAAINTSRAST